MPYDCCNRDIIRRVVPPKPATTKAGYVISSVLSDEFVNYLLFVLVALIILNICCLAINCYQRHCGYQTRRKIRKGKSYEMTAINDTEIDTDIEISNV